MLTKSMDLSARISAEVLHRLSAWRQLSGSHCETVLQVRLVDVGDRHHFDARLPYGEPQVLAAHASDPDYRAGKAVVGSFHVAGEHGRSQSRGSDFEKIAAACCLSAP